MTYRSIQPIKKRSSNGSETLFVFLLLIFAFQARFVFLGLYLFSSIQIQNWQTDFKKNLNNNQAIEWRTQRDVWRFVGWDTHFKGVMGK